MKAAADDPDDGHPLRLATFLLSRGWQPEGKGERWRKGDLLMSPYQALQHEWKEKWAGFTLKDEGEVK